MQDIYKLKVRPQALEGNIVQGEKYRFTFLTEGLVRLEYSEDGIFEDRATQFALYRDFPKTEFRVVKTLDGIEIHTSRIHLIYNEEAFSASGLSIQVKGNISNYFSVWHYGKEGCPAFLPQLKGTARTLDEADGEIPLENGIIGGTGYSVLNDSTSHRVTYYTYDVTEYLKTGNNELSVDVANGYYCNTDRLPFEPNYTFGKAKLIFELHITETNGKQVIKSG